MTKKVSRKPEIVETVHIFISRPNLKILTKAGKTDDPFVCIGSFNYWTEREQVVKGGSSAEGELGKPAAIPKIVGKVKRSVKRIRKRGQQVMGAIAHEIRLGDSLFVGFSFCSIDEPRFDLNDHRARKRAVIKLMGVLEGEQEKPGWLQAIRLGLLNVAQSDVAVIAEKKIEREKKKLDADNPIAGLIDTILGGLKLPAGVDEAKFAESFGTIVSKLTTGMGISQEILNTETGG